MPEFKLVAEMSEEQLLEERAYLTLRLKKLKKELEKCPRDEELKLYIADIRGRLRRLDKLLQEKNSVKMPRQLELEL